MFVLAACQTTGSGDVVTTDARPAGALPGDADQSDARPHRLSDADVYVPAPHMFVGQTGAMLSEYFGTPSLVRKEGEAEVHQFRTETASGLCVVLAFIYDGRGQQPGIRHISVRQGAKEATEPLNCLREIAYAFSRGQVP